MNAKASGTPPIGPHGGDAAAVARWLEVNVADIVDLSANLNPFAPDIGVLVAEQIDAVHRYPDATAAESVLAAAIGVDPALLILTNGGAEAIAIVAAMMPTGWPDRPTFSLYERHLAQIDQRGPVWRCNPSSPVGHLADPEMRADVWDEAYWPMCTGTWTRGDDDAWRVGSLTKLWACPGLRVGYAIAPTISQANAFRARQPRWAVNGFAAGLVERLVPDTDLPTTATMIANRRQRLVSLFAERGFSVRDTDACWVLVHRPGLRAALIEHRILVRDCASFGLPGEHRVVVPTDDACEQLAVALDQIDPADR